MEVDFLIQKWCVLDRWDFQKHDKAWVKCVSRRPKLLDYCQLRVSFRCVVVQNAWDLFVFVSLCQCIMRTRRTALCLSACDGRSFSRRATLHRSWHNFNKNLGEELVVNNCILTTLQMASARVHCCANEHHSDEK